jgi:uncharacterized membrane protein
MQTFLFSILVIGNILFGVPVHAQTPELDEGLLTPPETSYARGKVMRILNEEMDDNLSGFEREVQTVQIRVLTGNEKGEEVTLENGILQNRADMRLHEGETVILEKLHKTNGEVSYLIREKYRLPSVVLLVLIFVALSFVFGRLTGLMSMVGLLVSVLILTFFVVPQIVKGMNPMIASLIGAFAIACTSLYLAHGFKKRTSVALLSTLITLCISAILAMIFVRTGKLFGMGSEESMFLQFGQLQQVNLRGLLLGGIIIGCLGVLDDITTAQTAAIDEIGKANPKMTFKELHRAGISVGREHIASLINTLALAYVGASLPLLLLFTVQEESPFWVVLNSEFLAEEIIRTLVGSSTLLFAVPITTWLAAYFFRNDRTKPSLHTGHGHHH